MRQTSRIIIMSVILAGGVHALAAEAPWQDIFDGKTLMGWEVRGGTAKYAVEDACVVGRTEKGSPNTFLCTVKEYGDFVLEVEVKCDQALNSGIQIRSHLRQPEGEVFGCQVEIAPGTGTSGGVWDEARKSFWLHPTAGDAVASKAFRDGEWNKYRIECVGPVIRTFINDVKCADFVDTTDLAGFIGLQVHSVPDDVTAAVRWRNIRIQDLGRHVWKPLWDCATLSGWHALPGGQWKAENGILTGTSAAAETNHGLLVSDQEFADFTVRVVYKAVKGNSGLYFRSDESGDAVGVHGFQAEIDAASDIGGLYETGGRAWVVQPKPEDVAKWFRPQDWNVMTVHAVGKNVTVHVNGYKTAELKDDPGRTKGRFAVQMHGGQDMEIHFKEISLLTKGKVTELLTGKDLTGWTTSSASGKANLWKIGVPALDAADAGKLVANPGTGAMINVTPAHGESQDIYTTQAFGSGRYELEVMMAKGSNSGIYMMGEYEVQVFDSFGKQELSGVDMGSIYSAAPTPINASLAPGVWQKYVIDWQAPVFGGETKAANARFLRVELNGKVLHENLEIRGPTPGGVDGKEKPLAPIMFQGNHGPVAYRNIVVTEW